MVIATRRKHRSISPQSSSSSDSSNTTSSSSSSTLSSSDSSSDTEQSSAVSTRASSESERDDASVSSRRGPKTSASSVPRRGSTSASNYQKKNATPVKHMKGQNSSHVKSQGSSSHPTNNSRKASPKRNKITNEMDAKKRKALFGTAKSSDSEPERKRSRSPKSSKLSSSTRTQNSKKQKGNLPVKDEKSSDTGTNSNSATSGSESENAYKTSSSTVKHANRKVADRQSSSLAIDRGKSIKEEEHENSSRRFITRSSNKKSSSLLGRTKETDSDAEIGTAKRKMSVAGIGSQKQAIRSYNGNQDSYLGGEDDCCSTAAELRRRSNIYKVSGQRIKNEMLETVSTPPIEKRNCPVDGCDSTGHLGGLYDKHFTVDACPIYHDFTKEQCKSLRDIRLKDVEERSKARSSFNRSPRNSPSTEQKNYCNKIRDSRDCMSELEGNDDESADSDRQPLLKGFTPDWDLKLFQQAQAIASEKTENEMRGLPDTKGIRYIQMGRYEMEAWYQSQYPEDYNQQPKIYVCEFCLKYMRSRVILNRHAAKCVWKHPPGDEIYRKDKLSVWEVDGTKYKTFCQNLCLLAMLFLDHKTLYFDVEPFLFYIMSIADSEGCHIIGYFSKEKNSFLNFNVSCIMTLPPYQRQGYGRLLIDFSYLLTKEEGKIGSPEKPLSDLGLISYRSYWKDLLLNWLSTYDQKNVSIKDISNEMAVNSYDIVSTFQAMGMMKYWKGKHILLKRQDMFEEFHERNKKRKFEQREIDSRYLDWTPYVCAPQSVDDQHRSSNSKNSNYNNNTSNNNMNTNNGGNNFSSTKSSGDKCSP